jgi:hypothetical protein
VILYRPRSREDEVLDGIVAFVWDDVQSEEVTIEAHGGLRVVSAVCYRLDSESTAQSTAGAAEVIFIKNDKACTAQTGLPIQG